MQLLEEAADDQNEPEIELLMEGMEEISGETSDDLADSQAWQAEKQGS